MTTQATLFHARNIRTDALMIFNGETVTGPYEYVRCMILRLISSPNRPAFVIEQTPASIEAEVAALTLAELDSAVGDCWESYHEHRDGPDYVHEHTPYECAILARSHAIEAAKRSLNITRYPIIDTSDDIPF